MNRQKEYQLLSLQLKGLLENEINFIANLANTAALLYHSLDDINWAGFYLINKDELILGPFQGKPACTRIPIGKGVCGNAVAKNAIERVENVHEYPGHIACDCSSKSEIVIPIYKDKQCIGVLDIDSPSLHRFDEIDETGLQHIVDILQSSWDT